MTQHQTPTPRLPDPGEPESRRRQSRINALIIVGAALVIGVAWLVLDWPATSQPPVSHTVVYQADSTGTNAGSFTLETPTGSQQAEADLPLQTQDGGTGLTFNGFNSGDFVYLSVQNKNPTGVVTCRIVVDGHVISENTSTGGYVIATCSGRVP